MERKERGGKQHSEHADSLRKEAVDFHAPEFDPVSGRLAAFIKLRKTQRQGTGLCVNTKGFRPPED